MAGKRDEFPLLGIMNFYLFFKIAIPLALAGILIWAINQPSMELSDKGPLILGVLGLWAIWEVTRLVKWKGFTVVITDDDIVVGKQRAAWSEIKSGFVQMAVKFDTWIQLTPESGEPLKIPAGIAQKQILITLVEKHFPDLQKKG